MSGSRIARRQARSRAKRQGRSDINIVPMLDVMVILIFFLIFTAVFSKTRILELNLPAEVPQELEPIKELELEVIIRKDVLEVADRKTGLLQSFKVGAAGYDLKALADYLARVKARFPEKKDATLHMIADRNPFPIGADADSIGYLQAVLNADAFIHDSG